MARFCAPLQPPGRPRIALLLTAWASLLPLSWPDTSHASDCNSNGVEDATDIAADTSADCNLNYVPDDCEIAAGTSDDCNTNGVPDECDVDSFTQIAKLTASDAGSGDFFGLRVSISADTAVIGASRNDDEGFDSGSAYVYRRLDGVWREIAKLTASDAAQSDEFGCSVSISGDIAVVGARFDDDAGSGSGSAYVFSNVDGVWQEIAKLTASDAAEFDQFGFSTSSSGNTAVIGALAKDIWTGSAYVFREVAGFWQEVAKLTASDADEHDWFGRSVSISGNTAVIGAYGEDSFTGAAYVFREVAGVWQEVAKLSASDAAASDQFGVSVSISGETAIIGAPSDDDGGTSSGSAYVFRDVAGVWQEVAKLTASDAAAHGNFGRTVSISGQTAIIGSLGDDSGTNSGAVYVFREVAGVWHEVTKLTAFDAAAFDEFGISVSVSGGTAIIGASFDDDGGPDSGSAYIFDSPFDTNDNGVPDVCEPDCNTNGVPDDLDILGGVSADCNANAVPDECDLIAAFDYNADGAIDLADYAALAECLAGPDASPAPPVAECAGICLDAFDSDLDGDVDLADVAAFQAEFEGSLP